MTSALKRPHVLIVSADQELTDFLGEGLVYAGFWTSAIASAVQTLEVFRLRTFDIIVIDASLPGIGALELLRRLRGRSNRAPHDPRTDIPVLLIADSESDLSLTEALSEGADAIMVPPFELPELAANLWHAIESWRVAHPGRRWADEVGDNLA